MLNGIKDSANLTIRKKSDKSVFLYADYAKTTTTEWTAENVYAHSKDVKAIRWDYNKEATLNVSMEIFDLQWLAMLAGEDFVTGATDVFKRDVLTASATNTITLTETPTTGSLSIFKLEADGITNGTEQSLGTPATNINEYSIVGKVVTLNTTTAPEGTKFVAFYAHTSGVTAKKLSFKANKFPENYEITMDTLIRDVNGVDSYVQMTLWNLKPQPNFTLTNSSDEITVLDISFDILKNSTSDDMATYTIL